MDCQGALVLAFSQTMSVSQYLVEFFMAPLNYSQTVPELLPLVMGILILEVYFEKVNAGRSERADPVGNALLWMETGLALFLEFNPRGHEMWVVLFLIVTGGGLLLVEFMEKTRQKFAIIHSFVTPIYSVAYLSVILVATPLTVNSTSMKAGLIFMVIDVVFFTIWKRVVPVPNN